MITPRSVTSAGVAVSCFLLAVLALPARADGATLEIRSSVVSGDGRVELVVSVDGVPAGTRLAADAFSVLDTGATVRDLKVMPIDSRGLSVALVIDTSKYTSGRPIATAIAAADGFVSSFPAGTTWTVVTTGAPPRVAQAPTTDTAAVRAALSSIRASGGAALYDGLALTASTLATTTGQRNAIILSNGRDTDSAARMLDGVGALLKARVGTTVIGLATPGYGGNDGSITIARESQGALVKITEATGLAGALSRVAQTLSSQYALSYEASRVSGGQFSLSVGLAGTAAADAVTLLAPAVVTGQKPLSPLRVPSYTDQPWFAPFAEPIGLVVGLASVFLAGLLMFGPLLMPAPDRVTKRSLRKALSRPQAPKADSDPLRGVMASALGRAAVEMFERRMPDHSNVQKLQFALARSGWPLRAAEFRVIQAAAMVCGAVFGSVVLGSMTLAIVAALAGALIPRMLLRRRIEKRAKAFLKQLPAALDIIASSLQAGLSFMQALDGLVHELPDPAAAEFGRVLSEARLGMPVEDSLEAAAKRIDTEDFSWVVMAIVIQRRTGGNLAQLMRTVATTLRERAQVRQQIKVLSSEGRLSAVILIVLPFLLSGYIMVVNPGYIGKLFEVRIGQIMVAGALTLMGLGVIWMRKIIRIDI